MKDKTETHKRRNFETNGYVVSMEVDSVTTIEITYGDTWKKRIIKDLDWDDQEKKTLCEEVAWLEDFLIEKLEEKLK